MHKSASEMRESFELAHAKWQSEDWGDMHVSLEVYERDWDGRPFLEGLPGSQCQCPHWGYVLKGRFRVFYGDREESIAAGEAYHLPPGHAIVVDAGTELVELSPREEFARHMAAVEAAARARAQRP